MTDPAPPPLAPAAAETVHGIQPAGATAQPVRVRLPFQAIAAMALNRVIGCGNRLPWHLPEDFRWFKQLTLHHVLLMGRRTFASIGRALPQRQTIVLTRSGWTHPEVLTAPDLDALPLVPDDPRTVFVCGGAEVYAQALPRCSDLYLTLVKRTVEGDAFFPPFEDQFELVGELRDTPEFKILHYRNRLLVAAGTRATPHPSAASALNPWPPAG